MENGRQKQQQVVSMHTYPESRTCSRTNHPAEKCWRGARRLYVSKGIHRMPNPLTPRDMRETSTMWSDNTSTSDQLTSRKTDSKNLILPRLQIHDHMSVRRCVKTDPAIVKYNQFLQDTNGKPYDVW